MTPQEMVDIVTTGLTVSSSGMPLPRRLTTHFGQDVWYIMPAPGIPDIRWDNHTPVGFRVREVYFNNEQLPLKTSQSHFRVAPDAYFELSGEEIFAGSSLIELPSVSEIEIVLDVASADLQLLEHQLNAALTTLRMFSTLEVYESVKTTIIDALEDLDWQVRSSFTIATEEVWKTEQLITRDFNRRANELISAIQAEGEVVFKWVMGVCFDPDGQAYTYLVEEKVGNEIIPDGQAYTYLVEEKVGNEIILARKWTGPTYISSTD